MSKEIVLQHSMNSYILFLLMFPSVKGLFILTASPNPAMVGSTVIFTCITSPTQPAVLWKETINTYDEEFTLQNYIFYPNNSYCLKSTGTPPSDYMFTCDTAGVYNVSVPVNYSRHKGSIWSCADAFGNNGESNNITLGVQFPLNNVNHLNTSISPVTVNEGVTVTLVCETNPTDPISIITWRRDSQRVSQGVTSFNRSTTQGTVTVSFLTKYVQWADRGRYSCLASWNSASVNKTSEGLNLVVHVPVSAVTLTNITSNYQDISITEHSVLVLSCQTSPGYPTQTVTWYIKDIQTSSGVVNTANIQTNSQIITFSTITRTVTRVNDGDTYYCRAGRHQSLTSNISVYYPPDISLSPVAGTENSNLTLSCTASGNPSIYHFEDVRQYWGDRLIHRRPGSQTGNRYVLTLSQVTYQDSGVYVCTAGNNVKQPSHKNTTVSVKSSPVFSKDSIPNKMVVAEVNQNVTLSQYIYCSPNCTSVIWNFTSSNSTFGHLSQTSYVKPSKVHLDVYGVEVEERGYILSLKVYNFKQYDVGVYIVTACNSVGCSSSAVSLSGSGPPVTPEYFTAVNSTTNTVTLSWSPQYAGGSFNQEFHIEYRKQNSSGDWMVKIFADNKKTFMFGVVVDLTSDTVYVFRIKSVSDRRNGDNQSPYSEETIITTKEVAAKSPGNPNSSPLGVGAGIGIGIGISVTLAAAAAVAFIIWKRRQGGHSGERSRREDDQNFETCGTQQGEYAMLQRSVNQITYEKISPHYQNTGLQISLADNHKEGRMMTFSEDKHTYANALQANQGPMYENTHFSED